MSNLSWPPVMVYGMKRTTIYLPDEMKSAIERAAAEDGRTEAEVIRDAVAAALAARERPQPQIPLTDQGLGDPTIAERVDELLVEGFGS